MIIYGLNWNTIRVVYDGSGGQEDFDVREMIHPDEDDNGNTSDSIHIGLSDGTLLACWFEYGTPGKWRFFMEECVDSTPILLMDSEVIEDLGLIGMKGIVHGTDVVRLMSTEKPIEWVIIGNHTLARIM